MSKLTVNRRYATTPNDILNDPNLSLKAKGLWGYIQSKPDGWSFSVERIAKQTNDGKTAIKSGLKELEDAGLLKRTPIKNDKGQREGYDYMLMEKPLTENEPAENIATLSKQDTSKQEVVINKYILPPFLEKFIEKQSRYHQVSRYMKERGKNKYYGKQLEDYEKILRNGYTDKDVHKALAYVVQDEFRQEQIMTVGKLRQRNKEGVRYIDVLLDRANLLISKKTNGR